MISFPGLGVHAVQAEATKDQGGSPEHKFLLLGGGLVKG